jgi:hypothetical protein
MSFKLFWVKSIIFGENRVHQVNIGQAVSTDVKNESQAFSSQS